MCSDTTDFLCKYSIVAFIVMLYCTVATDCNILIQHETRGYDDREEEWCSSRLVVVVVVVGELSVSCRQQVDFMNYNLCYECLSIVFDCKRRLVWLPVGYQLATTRRLVAIVWQLVAN